MSPDRTNLGRDRAGMPLESPAEVVRRLDAHSGRLPNDGTDSPSRPVEDAFTFTLS
jgi:hypothetical protein